MRAPLVACLVLLWAPCRSASAAETASLDVGRYLGTWYEQARFPSFFEKGCVGVTATYSRRPDGELDVLNRCLQDRFDGEVKRVRGKAWIPDPKEPGKLKVQFFWPFSAPYWVLEVAPDYSWALVGHPEKKKCWILTRAPEIPDALYAELVEKLRARGYDVEKLERVPQRKQP